MWCVSVIDVNGVVLLCFCNGKVNYFVGSLNCFIIRSEGVFIMVWNIDFFRENRYCGNIVKKF